MSEHGHWPGRWGVMIWAVAIAAVVLAVVMMKPHYTTYELRGVSRGGIGFIADIRSHRRQLTWSGIKRTYSDGQCHAQFGHVWTYDSGHEMHVWHPLIGRMTAAATKMSMDQQLGRGDHG